METPPFDFAFPDFPLAPHTYYHVGGPAKWALLPRTVDEAEAAWRWLRARHSPSLVLGAGSNVLIADAGFPGYALFTTELTGLQPLGKDRYRVEAGAALAALVRDVMLPNNYDGIGALTGIPGSVGGAIFMNAGTVNGSACQLLESVDLAQMQGRAHILINDSLYSYRSQRFCGADALILSGVFRFQISEKDQRAVYDHYMQRRRETQPQGYCCGSVFKNPPGAHAGKLIEECGLKGARRGGAIISPQHANFIMNDQNACFDDIVGLIELAKDEVRAHFGIELEEEVRVIH